MQPNVQLQNQVHRALQQLLPATNGQACAATSSGKDVTAFWQNAYQSTAVALEHMNQDLQRAQEEAESSKSEMDKIRLEAEKACQEREEALQQLHMLKASASTT